MRKVLMVVLVVLMTSSFAYAMTDCKVCENLKSGTPATAIGTRLVHGIANAGFGGTELFFRPGKVSAGGGNPIIGFVQGIGNTVMRTGVGVLEVATFWVPGDPIVTMESCPLCAYR